MIKKFILFIFIINTINANTINIAVASNVSYAIENIVKEFKILHPETKVNITLGSSGNLTSQIKFGAPYDVFMSANMQYPNALYKNKIAKSKPVVYAKGTLSFLSIKKLDFSDGIKLLNNKNIKRIAIANPKIAPYGKASIEAINHANLYKDIQHKFIYAHSISQTLSYTLKASDIGIVATSLLYSSKMKDFKKGIDWLEINPKLYTPISQGIVIINNTKQSKDFFNFIISKKAKKIFKKFGYITND